MELLLSILCYAGLITIFACSIPELIERFNYELADIASTDANLFFTVGKAMTQGYRPYVDFYENKPPMIFALCAISYAWTGDFHMVNVDSFLCCLNLLILCFLIGPVIGIKRKWSMFPIALATLLVGSVGILMMTYAEARSGEIMTEIFGVSALMDGVFCLLLLPKEKKVRFYDPRVILAGFFYGVATMFKEPLGLLGICSFLFLCERKEDLLKKLVFPCVYGGLTAFLILLVTKSIPGYFTIYLPTMFGHHVDTYGPIWDRMVNVSKLFTNLNSYCWQLKVIVIGLFAVATIRGGFMVFSKKVPLRLTFSFLRMLLPLLFLYIASLSVGLGGQYFWHHYAFALPFYYALLIDAGLFVGDRVQESSLIRGKKEEEKGSSPKAIAEPIFLLSIAFSLAFSCITLDGLRTHGHDLAEKQAKMISYVETAKAGASYVDAILDALNEERYLFLGFNGSSRIYCYTAHLPLGPNFAQDPDVFYSEDNYFATTFVNSLHSANILVYAAYKQGVLVDSTKDYVSRNFTTKKPDAVKGIAAPKPFNYTLYFRNGAFN